MEVDARALKNAQDNYALLCQFFAENDWKVERNDETLTIEGGAVGNDLRMPITIRVRPDRQLVWLLSPLPFEVPDNKRLEVAAAVSIVNYRLINGCFEFNMTNGRLYFRMTNSFIDSMLSKEVFHYMVFVSLQTIDDYNDKFEALANGTVGIDAFME